MRRRLFDVLAVLSLLLFIATLAAWYCTVSAAPGVSASYARGGRLFYVYTLGPGVRSVVISGWPWAEPLHGRVNALWTSGDLDWHSPTSLWLHENHVGFAREWGDAAWRLKSHGPRPLPFRGVVIQWWLLFTAAALLPSIWAVAKIRWDAIREYRRQIALRGLCPVCEYDLRGTAGRCPECGTPTAPPLPRHKPCIHKRPRCTKLRTKLFPPIKKPR